MFTMRFSIEMLEQKTNKLTHRFCCDVESDCAFDGNQSGRPDGGSLDETHHGRNGCRCGCSMTISIRCGESGELPTKFHE